MCLYCQSVSIHSSSDKLYIGPLLVSLSDQLPPSNTRKTKMSYIKKKRSMQRKNHHVVQFCVTDCPIDFLSFLFFSTLLSLLIICHTLPLSHPTFFYTLLSLLIICYAMLYIVFIVSIVLNNNVSTYIIYYKNIPIQFHILQK